MAASTLSRDYDINRMLEDYRRRIEFLERQSLISPVALSIWQDVPGGFDTGWQEITSWDSDFAPEVGGNLPMVRRWGPVVHVKGRAATTVGAVSGTTVYTLPSGFGFEPTGVIHEAGRSLVPGSANADHRYYVTTNGIGSQQGMAALGIPADSLVSISTSWMVELP